MYQFKKGTTKSNLSTNAKDLVEDNKVLDDLNDKILEQCKYVSEKQELLREEYSTLDIDKEIACISSAL